MVLRHILLDDDLRKIVKIPLNLASFTVFEEFLNYYIHENHNDYSKLIYGVLDILKIILDNIHTSNYHKRIFSNTLKNWIICANKYKNMILMNDYLNILLKFLKIYFPASKSDSIFTYIKIKIPLNIFKLIVDEFLTDYCFNENTCKSFLSYIVEVLGGGAQDMRKYAMYVINLYAEYNKSSVFVISNQMYTFMGQVLLNIANIELNENKNHQYNDDDYDNNYITLQKAYDLNKMFHFYYEKFHTTSTRRFTIDVLKKYVQILSKLYRSDEYIE